MTTRLSFAPRATADLNEIWTYTQKCWGTEQAYSYVSRLVADCRSVLAGARPAKTIHLANGTFLRVRSGSHAAFLIEVPDGLRVVRVIHLKQDAEAQLG